MVLLKGLVVNLIFRFFKHGGTYENNHFLEQRKIMTIATPISINNKTTKVKQLKEDEFCVFLKKI
jgi:hypothetical protein